MKTQYYLLLFFSMAVLGWMMEVVCKKIQYGRFINRGFLVGPYCPIYGVGSVLIVLLLEKYSSEPIVVLLLAMVICGALEYMTSYAMEKLFHARWWDYSHRRFNLDGRVCAGTLIPFGMLGLLLIYVIKPFLFRLYALMSPGIVNILCWALSLIFAADVIISTNILGKIRSTASLNRADSTEALTKAVREALFKQSALLRRTFRAFPYVKIYNKPLLHQLRKRHKEFVNQTRNKRKALREEFANREQLFRKELAEYKRNSIQKKHNDQSTAMKPEDNSE